MPNGLVLVIEDDEWVSRLLGVAIREAGFEAALCGSAEEGLRIARERRPDCIICDVDLPDHDGYWVAQNVRTESSRVSVTPFLFLSSLDDQESRMHGFHVGADVYMTKPFRVDEVVAQVTALVQMAARLRRRRDSMISVPPDDASAIEGDLSQMSIATVLTVLEMERRSGTFEVVSKKRRATIDIHDGFAGQGQVGGGKKPALDVMRAMLSWNVGRFSFTPGTPASAPIPVESRKSIGAILMEACRLEDEEAAGIKRGGARSARLSAPALGGPASDISDMAPPPSSRRFPGLDKLLPPAADEATDVDAALTDIESAAESGDETVRSAMETEAKGTPTVPEVTPKVPTTAAKVLESVPPSLDDDWDMPESIEPISVEETATEKSPGAPPPVPKGIPAKGGISRVAVGIAKTAPRPRPPKKKTSSPPKSEPPG